MFVEQAHRAMDRRLRPGDERLGGRAAAVIVMFGAALLLPGLGSGHVLTYHEVVFAQPAKEMLATGNWLVPKIAGVPFNDKPPGTAWSIAACLALTGSRGEWVVRLPAVIAAVALAWIVAALAARWFGRTCGLLAGLIELTTVHALTHGRLAEADMPMTAAAAGALAVFGIAQIEQAAGRTTSRFAPWLFYALLATAFFYKGLIGPVLALVGCVAFAVCSRDLRPLRFLWNPIGLAIFVAPIAAWFAAAYREYPPILDDLAHHHADRFAGGFGRPQPWYYYAYQIPLLTLPWLPFAIVALVAGWRSGWYRDVRWRLLVCWFAPGLLVLGVSAFKAKHYALPLLPPVSILAAQGLAHYVSQRASRGRWHAFLLAALSIVGCTGAAVFVARSGMRAAHDIAALVGVLGLGFLAMVEFDRRRRYDAYLLTAFATAWVIGVGAQLLVVPKLDSYSPHREFAARIEHAVPPGQPVYLLDMPENQLTYYLNRPLVRLDDPRAFAERRVGDDAATAYAVAPRYVADGLIAAERAVELDRSEYLNRRFSERDRLALLRVPYRAAAEPHQITELHR
jgi:4-amino-4-deoxy-L-arabinose transferase-like glycosyltransferase